jgi:rubrerythrin
MADFTDIENEFRINLSAPDLDVSKAVEIALQVEERGRKFYTERMNIVSEPLKPFMKFLAEQEKEHEAALEVLKNSIKSMGIWAPIKPSQVQSPVKKSGAFKRHPGNEHRDSQADIQTLLSAMTMEKRIRDYYLKLAASIKSPNGRIIFNALADWEKKHYDMLSGLYNAESYVRLET